MTVSGLLSALVVGSLVAVLGRLVRSGRPGVPLWVTLAIGVVAALLGTVAVRLAGVDVDGFGVVELLVQIGAATVGVALALATGPDRAATPEL